MRRGLLTGMLAAVLVGVPTVATALPAHQTIPLLARHRAIAAPPSQVLTIVNQAQVSAAELLHIERALTVQATQLRAHWGTPLIRIGSGGWPVFLVVADGSTPESSHSVTPEGEPYATVPTGQGWSVLLSHEIIEMLIDPRPATGTANRLRGHVMEPCDPVENASYTVDGVAVSDFVFPAWFGARRGPWDWLRATDGPLDATFGALPG